MSSRTIHVDPTHPDPAAIAEAAELLRGGGLVAFPTETVYGLGANALDDAAVRRIFAAKGRPSFNPLIVHVAGVDEVRPVAREWPDLADALARAFWPGPLTIVVPKQPVVPALVTAGLDSVAVRAPAHPVARALLRAAALPVAAPSANRFTRLSPTTAAHVSRSLGNAVDLVLDGGPAHVGIESTVVDVTGGRVVLLRPGVITADAIAQVAGPVTSRADLPKGDAPRPSPGMVDRHYAPVATLRLFDPADPSDIAGARAAAAAIAAGGRPTGALTRTLPSLAVTHLVRMPEDPDGYARALYASLHELDDRGCALVLVERVPETNAWAGVRDRLGRAATPA
ncbi:MAG TPA: L-threonylcarbamoyladenylate synthase [Solirubrobacteraceae bacterium]|nr:L-threonylcarbamoyladenylate synthase [Solirubrobacteraceae bacterium]